MPTAGRCPKGQQALDPLLELKFRVVVRPTTVEQETVQLSPEQQELLPLSPSPAPGTQFLGLVLSFKGLS